MKKLSIAALALTLIAVGAVAFAPDAGAQTAPTFMTIDAVSLASIGFGLTVSGVKEGEAAPSGSTITFTADAAGLARFEACHRTLLLALSKPGQYVLRLGGGYNTNCAVAVIAP
jgi:hypothetical protein